MPASTQPFTIALTLAAHRAATYDARVQVAVASIRVSNPLARIVVVCDRQTDDVIRSSRPMLIEQVDEWKVVDTPDGNAEFQSRFIRTTLRNILSGPFLMLDSDVVVRGALREVFSIDCDVAGAPNHSRNDIREQVWIEDQRTLDAMSWRLLDDAYLNGGVLFFNDTANARRLASEWHVRWTQSMQQRGSVRDQPALNSALCEVRPSVHVLPHRFNAQVYTSPWEAANAVIWHFYASNQSRIPSRYTALVRAAAELGHVPQLALDALLASDEPWSPDDATLAMTQSVAFQSQLEKVDGELREALARGEVLDRQLALAHQDVANANQALARANRHVDELLATRSWRLTRPLRVLDELLRRLRASSSRT